ncbi:MAG TPA: hypothetical protein VIK95_01700 [Egibacteraceae bacterium]
MTAHPRRTPRWPEPSAPSRRARGRRRGSEDGAAALVTLATAAVAAFVALAVAVAAADVGVAAARARTAADAAALAAVATSPLTGGDGGPEAAAARLARANGAAVVATDRSAWPLRVTVAVAVPPRTPLVRGVTERVVVAATAAVRPPETAPDLSLLGFATWPEDGGALAGTSPVVAVDPATVLRSPRVQLTPQARADLVAGVVDTRVVAVLAAIAQRHSIGVSVFRSGHSRFVAGTRRESNHHGGRAVDIATVDGRPVTAAHPGARAITVWLAGLQGPLRPSEVGSPFAELAGRAAGHFSDAAHRDHLHLGWRPQ